MIDIADVQKKIAAEGFDGWLLYDFRRSNDLACSFLQVPGIMHLTRRFFYWIPAKGEPVLIVSSIEEHVWAHLPGKKRTFFSWKAMQEHLKGVLQGVKKVAMEYSPQGAVPYVSKVDAGTVEMVRSFGVEVGSSASFLQYYTCVLSDAQLKSHLAAADVLEKAAKAAWEWVAKSLKEEKEITEYDVQQLMVRKIAEGGCTTDTDPICAVNEHTANPHYGPLKDSFSPIKKGDFILIDLWCKKKEEGSVYADIARVAVASGRPSDEQQKIFALVRKAQKTAVDLIETRLKQKEMIRGCEADAVSRKVIADAGFGEYFLHRTGHNIYTECHGPGAQLDSIETLDDRPLLAGTCFSVEPGIYLPGKFGVRLEHDVYIEKEGKLRITGGVQEQIVTLL